ncbi:MAG: transglycosylase SLT domain-containing protein [Acinetobacter sp.]|nr:transglycosylase SLT domain-containing protein [Acinetobacter sp.]
MAQVASLVIRIDSREAERRSRDLQRELESIDRTGEFATKSMDSMSVATRKLAGFMAGLITINQAISRADSYTQLAARIRNATESAEEYDLVQKRLFESTKSTYRALSEAQEVYLGLTGGMKALNYTVKDTLDVSDSLSFAFVANAARADQAQSAIDAFSKSMAKGKVDANAWISIVSAADNIIADMAKTTGRSEVEIRKLGATGKIALDDLIKTLKLTKDANKDLADAMENSLADGLTTLSNAVTQFLGELNMSTGATSTAAAGLGVLADNIESVMDVAMLGGVAYLTKAIITQTTALHGKVAGSIASRQASIAQVQAEVQLLGVEAMRAKQLAALASSEINLARAQYNGATNANARAAAVQRLTAAEISYSIAVKGSTMATNNYAAAQARLATASLTAGRLARGAFALIGGPIGAITLGVTGLAAAYMFLSNRVEKSTKSFNEQGKTLDEILSKYQNLDEVKKRSQLRAETESLESLTNQYQEASRKLTALVLNLYRSGEASSDVAKQIGQLAMQYKQGKLTAEQLANQLNQLNGITSKGKTKIDEHVGSISKLRSELQKQKNVTQEMLAQSKKSVEATNAETRAVNEKRIAQEKLLSITQSLNDRYWDSQFKTLLIQNHSKSKEEADLLLKTYRENQEKGYAGVTNEQKIIISNLIKQEAALDAVVDKDKEHTKELEKQQQILQVNAKVRANAAKHGFSDFEKKYGLQSGTLSAVHMIESKGNANAYNKSTGATGGFQFLDGTAKQYGVKDRTDLTQAAEGAAKYLKYLLGLFKGDLEKAVRAYHAGEGNVQKGKNIGKYNNQYWKDFQGYMAGLNGYQAGDISSKDFEKLLDESVKMAEQQAQTRIQLEQGVADQVSQIRHNLAEKIKEINAAGYSSEEAKKLISQYQELADNDIAIAEHALKTKLDDYKAFTKTEEQLLRDSFAKRQFDAKHDIEFTEDQRKEAANLLDRQLQHELGLIKLAQEQRLFQANQYYMSEIGIMQERYRLERLEIAKTHANDPAQRAALTRASLNTERKEVNERIREAAREMGQIKFDMQGGMSQLDQENLTKFQRHDSNDKQFSSRIAGVELHQESEVGLIQSQFEQGLITQQEFEDQKTAIIQAALEQRNNIYSQFVDNQKQIDDAYNTAQIEFYMNQAQGTIGAFQGMFGAVLGEQSSAYRAMYAASRTFALAQAGMNLWKSASDAYAAEPGTVWQKLGASAKAVIDNGTFIAMIQAATPPAFATGGLFTKDGYVRGPGTTTSDSINARLSDKEFVTNAWAVRKIGLENMEYMNRTGEIPQNYAEGGLFNNASATRRETRQFDAINMNRQSEKTGNIQISQSITFSDGNAKIDTQGQKDVAQSLNAAMDAWARRESRQGGVLYNLTRK